MVAGSNVTGWLSGNAVDYGLDDHGFEYRRFLQIFFYFLLFSKYFLSFSAGTIAIAYCVRLLEQ